MEVILLERIEKLGQMGDVVKVKPGYARNYLLPQRKALRATKGNLTVFEAQRAQLEAQREIALDAVDVLYFVLIEHSDIAGFPQLID